jgi:hypothetical protein
MKKNKRSPKYRKAKTVLHQSSKQIVASAMGDEEVRKHVTTIARSIVDDALKALHENFDFMTEDDGEWLAYFERGISLLEEGLGRLLILSPENISKEFQGHGLKKDQAHLGREVTKQFTEQLVRATRYEYHKELYDMFVGLEAHKLRMALRDEVHALSDQFDVQGHRFVTIPDRLDELVGEDKLDLDEKAISDTSLAYCTDIWFMMADIYPPCPTHFYLECMEGWFSADVYGTEEEADQEAERRKEHGEGDFEVRYIEECDLAVLFTKSKPKFVG